MRRRMRGAGLILGVVTLAGLPSMAGCRTPAEQSRAAHAKLDPRLDVFKAQMDTELDSEIPAYRSIVDKHDRWANYLRRYAEKYQDPSFNAAIADLYRRNADIYERLNEPANAEKYRGLATQYDPEGGGGAVVEAGTGPQADPDAGDGPPPVPEVRVRVAVLPLGEPKGTKESYGYGEQFSGFLYDAFDKLGGFDLAERSAIRHIMAERNLAETQVEGDAARELGKLLHVDFLVVGYIGTNPQHTVFNVNARLVDTASGKGIASAADTIKDGNAGFAPSSRRLSRELSTLYNERRK